MFQGSLQVAIDRLELISVIHECFTKFVAQFIRRRLLAPRHRFDNTMRSRTPTLPKNDKPRNEGRAHGGRTGLFVEIPSLLPGHVCCDTAIFSQLSHWNLST